MLLYCFLDSLTYMRFHTYGAEEASAVGIPFFDANATDAARFLFGTENPQVICHPGTISLNALLDDRENEQVFAGLE